MAYDPKDPADKKIVQDLIDAALAEAETAHDTAVTALKDKNTQLIKEKRELQQGRGKPEDIAALEAQLEDSKTQLEKANKDLVKVQKVATEATEALATEKKFGEELLVDGQLADHLVANNVAPQFMPAVKALLRPQAQVKTDKDGRAVVVGEKSLGDYIKEWSQGDTGKAFVAAPANGGGGAQGGKLPNGQTAKTISRADYEGQIKANPAAGAELMKSGVTITD